MCPRLSFERSGNSCACVSASQTRIYWSCELCCFLCCYKFTFEVCLKILGLTMFQLSLCSGAFLMCTLWLILMIRSTISTPVSYPSSRRTPTFIQVFLCQARTGISPCFGCKISGQRGCVFYSGGHGNLKPLK